MELPKTKTAKLSHKTVTETVKSNSANNNASDARLVMLDRNLLVTFAKHQDQPVLATSNTTHRLIDVTTAQMDNSQVTSTLVETRTTKTVYVLLQHKTVPQATQSNSANKNAIDARLVMLEKLLSTTDVQSDQLVLAISNTTHRLTDVTTAQSDN